MSIKETFYSTISQLQDEITSALGNLDGVSFKEDNWERLGGGGGKTRIIEFGNIFEKGGVNLSEVFGDITPKMKGQIKTDAHQFYATGLSTVIHPDNPFIPTIHANIRYFELTDTNGRIKDQWFGGGIDMTPYYLFEEDAIHLHSTLKNICDSYDLTFYPQFKKACDIYFYNHHREEARGVGGIFFDRLEPDKKFSISDLETFTTAIGKAFLPIYLPIVEKRVPISFDQKQKEFQELRRGRYVEFNLLYDRGTQFGLQSAGRIESIFMSLPPTVKWQYDYQPADESAEAHLLEILKKPKEWIK